MYVSENGDNIILSESMKDRKYTRCCSVSYYNLNLTTIDLYAAIISLAIRFTQFLIGSSKCILLRHLFSHFLQAVFVYNTHRLMT